MLGVNGSGTTLLVRLLASHPQIRGLPKEGQRLTHALLLPRNYGVSRLWTERPDVFRLDQNEGADRADRAQHDWALHFPPGPGVLLEKSPPNTLRALWLQRYFRPNRFVATTRSPYAVAEGIRRRQDSSIEDAARHWARAYDCLLADAEQLGHLLWVRYEELCENPERELDRIEGFLTLPEPFDRAILNSDFDVHSLEPGPHPISDFNAKSLARLSPDDIATIGRVAGPTMERLGYERL